MRCTCTHLGSAGRKELERLELGQAGVTVGERILGIGADEVDDLGVHLGRHGVLTGTVVVVVHLKMFFLFEALEEASRVACGRAEGFHYT